MPSSQNGRGMSRREFLKIVQVMGVAAVAIPLLEACAPAARQPAPAAGPQAAAPTEASAAGAPAAGAQVAGGLKDIPRNKTFIAVRGGTQGKFVEWDQWNPFVPVANHQFAVGLMYEPLAFYSAFADKEYMWLAESYTYSDDFKTLTARYSSDIAGARRTVVTVRDRLGRSYVDEYIGTPARHVKVTDHLGRVRTQRGTARNLKLVVRESKIP